MVGSSGAGLPADVPGAHPLRLVAVTHGAPSAANREAVIRLVDGVASERPELDVSISFVDAANRDVAASLAAAAEPDAVIVPLVLSAGFHVRTGLSLGLDLPRMLRKEILTGLGIGVILAGVFFVVALALWGNARTLGVVAFALFAASAVASVVAFLLPWLVDGAGVDPAFGAGPLATVIQDLLSIAIYLWVALAVLG